MAVIPGTKFATAEPSGRTGQTTWGAPPQGEGQAIAQGISKIGGAILAYALDVQQKEMTAEYYEKQRLIDEAGWAARESVVGDEEADNALWEKAYGRMLEIAGSSKYKDVNDRLMQNVNQVSPNWAHGIRMASLGIQADNANAQQKYNLLEAFKNRDQTTVDAIIKNGVETKTMPPAEVDHYQKYGQGYGSLARVEEWIANGRNDLALLELEQMDSMDLTTEQLRDKRVLKLTAEKNKDENDRKLVNDILAMLSEDKMPLNDVLDLIVKRTDIDSVQKTNLAEVAIGGAKIWQKTGENPFTVTRDWPSFWKARDDIYTGKITSPRQLLERQLSDTQNGPLWSNVQYNDLVGDLPSEDATGFSDDPVVKGYLANLRLLYAPKDKDIPDDKLGEYAPAYGELVKSLRLKYKNGDYQGMHDEFERVTGKTKERQTKSLLNSLWTVGSPLGMLGKVTGTGKFAGSPAYLLFSAGIRYLNQNQTKATLPEKSPFPEYPDAYLEDGMWTVMRDGKKYRIQP